MKRPGIFAAINLNSKIMTQIQFVGVEPETLIQAVADEVTGRVLAALPDILKPKPADKYLNLNEAAAFLNLKPASMKPCSIYNKIASRELPHIKRGNRLYFLESDLREYLNGGRQMTAAEVEAAAATYCNEKSGFAAAGKGGDR